MTRARPGVRRAGAALAAGALLAGCSGVWPLRHDTAPTPSPTPTASPTASPTATPTAAPAPSAPASPTPTASPTAAPTRSATPAPTRSAGALRRGDSGPAVLALQQRLTALGYWLGGPDGSYGDLTEQAVLALQKAAHLSRDGVTGPATLGALRAGVRPAAQSGAGWDGLEIDVEHQLLLVVRDGRAVWALNTSTGSGRLYQSHGDWRRAVTPRGRFTVQWQYDGLRRSDLGLLYRPKYFYGGYAVHGSTSVPAWPASHGCVRVSNAAADWFWTSGLVPLGSAVWVR